MPHRISRSRQSILAGATIALVVLMLIATVFVVHPAFLKGASAASVGSCVARVAAVHKSAATSAAQLDAITRAAPAPQVTCGYKTVAAALAAATGGRVALAANANNQQLLAALAAEKTSITAPSLASDVAAVFFWNANYSGPAYVVVGTSGPCNASTLYSIGYIRTYWNNEFSSAEYGPGMNCNIISEWEFGQFGGAEAQAENYQPYIGDAMNDRTGSMRLTDTCPPDCVH